MTNEISVYQQKKQPYVPPKLVLHGQVRVLTQAGSKGAIESPGNPGNCTSAANKKC